jgi:spermidine synthase
MAETELNESSGGTTAGQFLPLLLILFAGSGCAALIYEIVWLQLLQLVVGSTAVSLGVLLGTFMGGMCLGSLLLPRLIPARWHPLRVYAVLELLIGVIGLAVLKGIPAVADWYTGVAGAGWTGLAMRGVVAGVCLLPPTLLMGATLPAIARWIKTTQDGVAWMGFFYGGNIAGAVVGCLWAGFYLLRVYDMATATYYAVGINVAVALIAAITSAFAKYEPQEISTTRSTEKVDGVWSVYFTIALSGLTGLAAEVIWTRLLSLMLGMTVYAFSNILAVFLVGLGFGSSVGAMWARMTRRPRVALGTCQIMLAGTSAWAAINIAKSLPYWPVSPELSKNPWFTFQLDLARCFWVVLPGAILWGASFPLALAAVAEKQKDSARLVGGVYAANTIGAIIGSLIFSMVLIPNFGTKTAEQVLIALCAVSSLVVLLPACVKSGSVLGSFSIAGAMAGVVWLICVIEPVPWVSVAYGRFAALPDWTNISTPAQNGDRVGLYVGEGMNVSVAVTEWGGYRFFHGAGKVQASSMPQDMRLQRMLGDLSALIAKKNENVLVVACGAGVTAGSFIPYPTVKHITICDIEPLVPHHVAATYFAKENYGVVDDPRTTVVIDDGRHFIRTTHQKFDIITSDPIDPWVKGCAALNTVEYYQMCKEHLNPGGVVSLWIPLYESQLESARSLIATFFQVFPNGIIFSNDEKGEGYDAVLLGQVEPTQIDVEGMQKTLDSPGYERVRQSLLDVGFGTPGGKDAAAELLSTFAGRAPDMKPWSQIAIDKNNLNTDANLRLQYLAGLYLNQYEASAILDDMLKYYRFPAEIFTGAAANIEALRATLEQEGRARFVPSASAATPK